jgi:glycine/D-amino acid oxidase-like deaminating enzyme
VRSRDVDVVVVGLGALGPSALHELARDDVDVVDIEQFQPGHANGSSHGRSRALRCLYTVSPDDHLLLGRVPGAPISLGVGLGHAFKFAPVTGRILADLATTGISRYPIDRFRVDRFVHAAARA